jgi:predicted permease
VAVISHRLWNGYFRANPKVVGSTVRLNGRAITIVGVAAPDFRGTIGGLAMDVWTPLSMATQMGALNTWAGKDRNARYLVLMARLKPGVHPRLADQQVRAVAARIAAAYPDTHRGVSAELVPLAWADAGVQRFLGQPLRILMAVCLLVLLIACANVTNLLLARSLARRREFGVRAAMGAGRAALVRLLVTEAVPLAAGGALLGLLLSQWGGEAMGYLFPAIDSTIRYAAEPLLRPALSLRTAVFCAAVSLMAAAFAVVVPGLAAARIDIQRLLAEGGRSGMRGVGARRVRSSLVVAEISLAALALTGAGAALEAFRQLRETPLGFRPEGVSVSQFHLSTSGYSLARERDFAGQLTSRLRQAPGVEDAAVSDVVPLSLLGAPAERFQLDGAEAGAHAVPMIGRATVSPRFFEVLRLPIVAGRGFTEQDHERSARVIVVNQTLARQFFGTREAVGRQVRVSGRRSTIVGVVRDAKYYRPGEPATPFFYGPFRQIFFSGHNHFLLMRTKGDASLARKSLSREVQALDPSGALYESAPMLEHIQASTFAEKLAASLLATLGVLALVLSAVGLYAVLSYSVQERTREFGIRMALGAQPGRVMRQVVGNGFVLALIGLAAGMGAALLLLRMPALELAALERGNQPAVAAAAAGILLLVALAACVLPALRATRSDPMRALRAE